MPETPSNGLREEQYPTLLYRKHKIKRYRRHLSGGWFWVAEIWKPDGTHAYASVLRACDRHELKDANDEADRLVGIMMANHGRVPQTEVGPGVVFGDEGLESLNPRSASGKPQWCERHWQMVMDGMVAETHNGIVAGILLTSLTIQKLQSDGLVTKDPKSPFVMEMIRDSYSPFCCWLGDDVTTAILFESQVDRVTTSGILQRIEQQLLRGKK